MASSLSSTLLQSGLSRSQFFAEKPVGRSASAVTPAAAAQPSRLAVVAVKKIQGTVVRTTSDKTAAVEVKRIYAHKLYKKRITSVKTYQAHDPLNTCKVGDMVTLVKCAPVSKTKKFIIADIQPPRVAGEKAAAARAIAAEAADGDLPPLESDVAFV